MEEQDRIDQIISQGRRLPTATLVLKKLIWDGFSKETLQQNINSLVFGWSLLHWVCYSFETVITQRELPDNIKPLLLRPLPPALTKVELFNLLDLIIGAGANINLQDKWGRAPISFAKDKDLINYLIDKDADVNPVAPVSPLHVEARHKFGISSDVSYLLQQGANPCKKDSLGRFPLHCAVISCIKRDNSSNVLRLLEYFPSAVDSKDSLGYYSLSYALMTEDLNIIDPILEITSIEIVGRVVDQIDSSRLYLGTTSCPQTIKEEKLKIGFKELRNFFIVDNELSKEIEEWHEKNEIFKVELRNFEAQLVSIDKQAVYGVPAEFASQVGGGRVKPQHIPPKKKLENLQRKLQNSKQEKPSKDKKLELEIKIKSKDEKKVFFYHLDTLDHKKKHTDLNALERVLKHENITLISKKLPAIWKKHNLNATFNS